MKNIKAILYKQLIDTLKNKMVFIQFIMFPAMAVIMENSINLPDMPPHFFVHMFSAMYVGMAPLISISSIISEEKEKNTLRALMMTGVQPWQYVVSVGGYVFLMCIAGTAVFAVLGEYSGEGLAVFISVMLWGIILSEIVGAVIGIYCKNQMSATSLTVPVMMIFSFVPMLSAFNESIRKAGAVLYSQQISEIINGIGSSEVKPVSIAVIGVNFIAGLLLLAAAYRKRGLE